MHSGRAWQNAGMAKRQDDSALVAAAAAFDRELEEYGRLAELLLKTPLRSVKQLERANQAIEEITATEERLRATGQGLAKAIADAHGKQQGLAEQMVAHLPAVAERNGVLRGLVGELHEIAAAMRELNAATANGGAAVREVEEKVGELAARAEAIAVRAREADFEETATQAHALHQQMAALGKKLRAVTSQQS